MSESFKGTPKYSDEGYDRLYGPVDGGQDNMAAPGNGPEGKAEDMRESVKRQDSINAARNEKMRVAKIEREKVVAAEKAKVSKQPSDIKSKMSDGEKRAKMRGLI